MSRHVRYQAGSARVRAAATAALVLVAGLLASSVAASPSDAARPGGSTPTILLQLTAPTTANTAALTGAPSEAVPDVLAAKGVTPISTVLSLSDGSELNKGTVVNLAAVKVSSTGKVSAAAGTFTPSTFTVPERGTSFPISVTYSRADTDVFIQASMNKPSKTSPGPGLSPASFDVVDTLAFAFAANDQGPNDDAELRSGFGAAQCTAASTAKVCGIVVLPQGITSAAAALSSGICADTNCNGAEEVQFIAGLSDLYTAPAPPAMLILRCDKATCKGKGVSNYTARISLLSSGELTDSPACTTKGVLDSGTHFCTDYVSSHRDNAGDLLLEVLFDKDMRGTI
jgi:hypothetical protein